MRHDSGSDLLLRPNGGDRGLETARVGKPKNRAPVARSNDLASEADRGLASAPERGPARSPRSLKEVRGYTNEELSSVAALGHLYYSHHHFAEAQVVFAGLMAIDPTAEYYARGYAASCLLAGDTTRALEAINRALELARDLRPSLLLRAQVLIARRAIPEAERDLNYVLRISAAHPTEDGSTDPVTAMASMVLERIASMRGSVGSQSSRAAR